MIPDLSEARRLFQAGFHLVPLERYTKKPPEGIPGWNKPENRAKSIESDATGYGFPLSSNQLCSIDPDNWPLALRGMAALGFDLEALMVAGVRTKSTRHGSGGRSTFREEPDLSWLKFASRDPSIGTVLELRADSANLQDVVPGLVYFDKEGTLCTQQYANCKRLDDAPGLPDDFLAWWQRCSTDIDFLREQQDIFMQAIGAKANLAISTGRGDVKKLAFDAPGYRGWYNHRNRVEDILSLHGYEWHAKLNRWSCPTASGAPGIRLIPGKNDLWQSDHASDPLSGTFDAWIANVVLNHFGNVEAAMKKVDRERNSAPAVPAVLYDTAPAGSVDAETGEIVADEVVRVAPPAKPTAYVDPLPFPSHLLQAPGIMGEFLRWMMDCAQKPQPVLALAAVINLIATALAQKVQTNTGFRTNFYTVGVGPTSAGKDHARKCNKVAMNAAGIGNLIGGEELASSQGLLARAAKEPKTLFQIDEFGLFLQAITSHSAGSHLKQITTVLMKLFTTAGSVYHGTEYADQTGKPRVDIAYPCINMHATTTPETLFEAFTGADVTSGSLNRMLFFFAPEREGNWPMRFVNITQPPESLTAWLKAAWMMPGSIDPATPVTVPMSPEATQQFELLYDYQQDCERKAKPNGTDGLYGRMWEHASKLALVAAVARHANAETLTKVAESSQLVVTGTDASWAIELVCYLIKRMDYEVTGRVADSEFGRDKKNILSFIEKAGKFGLTERELAKVCRKFGGMNPLQRQAVMTALMNEEAVARVDFAPPSGRGRHRVAVVSTTYYSLENQSE